ncbi:hypothetical protein J6590_023212 [Homalodisca vitripennis]|nr:hypothetical protein J6590_023212 [Homalodisca vitripennis]
MAIQLIFRYPIPDQLGSRSDGHGLHRKVAHCGLYLTLQLKGLVISVYLVLLEVWLYNRSSGILSQISWVVDPMVTVYIGRLLTVACSNVTAQGAGHLCVSCTSGGMAIQLIFRYPIPDQLGSRSYGTVSEDQLGSRSDGHGLHRKVAHCGLYLTLQLKGLVISVYLVPLEEGGSLWPVSYVTAQGAGHLCVSCTSGGMAIQLIFRYPIPDQLGSRSDGHGLHRKVAHCGLYLTLKLKGLVTSVYLVPLEYGYTTDLPVTYPRSAG